MARRKMKLATKPARPTVRLALAAFAIVCGVILLVTGARNRGGEGSEESAASRKLRQTAGEVRSVLADAEQLLGEVENARNAVEATDYGQVRLHLLRVEDGLNDLGARLDGVRSTLEQLAGSSEISRLPTSAFWAAVEKPKR